MALAKSTQHGVSARAAQKSVITDTPLLEVRHLIKTYGKKSAEFQALKNLDLTIYNGESVAIIGKSGSGKSTLMHILALLDQPTSGKVLLDGIDTRQLKTRAINQLRNKKFGFVFQQFFMNSRDTVLDNVMLPLKIAGVGTRESKRRALQALKIVELADKASVRANDLSGGQKQRVCIARAIVNHPSVIFADEPTGNLDSQTGERVENLLFGLNQKTGITLIIVTHDPELAAKCERQMVLKDGCIVEVEHAHSAAELLHEASRDYAPTTRPNALKTATRPNTIKTPRSESPLTKGGAR
jgi:putative ABC transport system ATP-binding protein